MLTWLTENLATILIGAAVLTVVSLIIASLIRNKRKGKSSCGCGCGDCPMGGACHEKSCGEALSSAPLTDEVSGQKNIRIHRTKL